MERLRLRIDRQKTFLPLTISKGTTEQRLQKARLVNLKFFDSLQDKFVGREVKPYTFKRTLAAATSKKIRVELFKSEKPKETRLTPFVPSLNKIKGFALYLPHTYVNESIHKSSQKLFLNETQNFFDKIFNPKFLTREITLFNKKINVKEAAKFYDENIFGKQQLQPEMLDEYLSKKTRREQINILQYFRYTLLGEKNIHQAEAQIDRHIEKADNLQFPNKNYDLSKYYYDEKLDLLNKKLLELIQEERQKHKLSVSI